MFAAPLPAPLRLLAPDLAFRLGLILTNLAAIVARRFLREPRYVALIVPLWTRLNRAARRFERLMARLAAGSAQKPRRSGRSGRRTPALPTGHGWIVRALGHEAAACASQLQFLLSEPGVADLLNATPAAGRILRPLAHMLGLPPIARPEPRVPAPAAPPPPSEAREAQREPRPCPVDPVAEGPPHTRCGVGPPPLSPARTPSSKRSSAPARR